MKQLCLLLASLLLVSAVQADSVSVVQLQHRPAAEVVPVIAPMLGPNDAISGEGFKIFVRASAEGQQRVRSLVERLDTPARVLQVSVFQGSEHVLHELALRGNVQVQRGDTTIDVGSGYGNEPDGGGRIIYSTSGGSASVDAVATQRNLRGHPIHRVRVTEGKEAYIETGERIPYFAGVALRGRRALAGGVQYENVVTGFYALPRIRGDNVVLEVSPFKTSRSDSGRGNVETQSATTTVTGRAGEWLFIGGISEQTERTESAVASTYATQGSRNTGIWIKAELVE